MKHISIPLIIAALTLTACGGTSRAGKLQTSSHRVITLADHGKKIALSTDEIFTVSLEANAGSGYEWHLHSSDTGMIQLLERKNIPQSENGPDFVGGSYRDQWVFKIQKKGQSQLRFDLFPPWEGPQAATKTVTVTIIVQQ